MSKEFSELIYTESTTIPAISRDGLDFSAAGGKRQGREVPKSLRVEPGASHPGWKTQSLGTQQVSQSLRKLYHNIRY
jgi:hypothetical protein